MNAGGVFESNNEDNLFLDKAQLTEVMEDSIAKTCLHILVSLVNQNMNITSKDKKVRKVFKDFNRKAQIKRKMDSIVFNQLGYGTGVIYFDVTIPKIKVYDNETITIIHNPLKDEFEGLWQRAQYLDPNSMKRGVREYKWMEAYIPEDDLLLIPGIGTGYGDSLLEPAIPYVTAKRELVDSLYELVKRLGLLTRVGVDLPGDISDSNVDTYLDIVTDLVQKAAANTTWILPKEVEVEGVRGSGEARIIESVKVIIDMLDEEIRKCIFVPDTFLTSLSANRATAKEQRYLIASMVQHIRDLIEEALRPLYDKVLKYEGIDPEKADYTFSWGNINMPEPEALFTFLTTFQEADGITIDEVRKFLNLGDMPPELIKRQKEKEKMRKIQMKNMENPQMPNDQGDIYNKMKGGGNSGQGNTGKVQPKQTVDR